MSTVKAVLDALRYVNLRHSQVIRNLRLIKLF